MQALSDLEALRTLKARYCRYTDAKRWADVAALFTDDALMAFYDASGELELASDRTATGAWPLENFMFHDPETDPEAPDRTRHGFGRYRETYRKVDSRWPIARLELHRIRIELTY